MKLDLYNHVNMNYISVSNTNFSYSKNWNNASLNSMRIFTVDMESLIYLTATDYNDRPKPILASLIGTSFVIFYKIHGYDILSSCVFTFVSVEIFIRILCAIVLANL
jgi:hypothetical protein